MARCRPRLASPLLIYLACMWPAGAEAQTLAAQTHAPRPADGAEELDAPEAGPSEAPAPPEYSDPALIERRLARAPLLLLAGATGASAALAATYGVAAAVEGSPGDVPLAALGLYLGVGAPLVAAGAVITVGEAYGVEGSYWASALGALAGSVAAFVVVSLPSLAGDDSSGLVAVGSILLPTVGAWAGFELSAYPGEADRLERERRRLTHRVTLAVGPTADDEGLVAALSGQW